jgi:hypothetical protein
MVEVPNTQRRSVRERIYQHLSWVDPVHNPDPNDRFSIPPNFKYKW